MKLRHQTTVTFDRISTSTITHPDTIPDEIIRASLAHKLAQELTPFVHFYSHLDQHTLCTRTTASVNVANTDIQHAQIETEGFHLNGQVFDSSQISQALLHTYPERFI